MAYSPDLKKLLFICVFLVGSLSTFSLYAGEKKGEAEYSELSIISAKQNHTFKVEVAITEAQRAKGLMFRQTMAQGNGMLFLFDKIQMVIMWMKNTYIPLDIIFIDQNNQIIHIAKSTVPESLEYISSKTKVKSVLELNAGVTDRLNIQIGDKVSHTVLAQ